ncbi:MAG: hypothetical protein GX213_05515 [Clostridiaceae bacterium]|nr:hypothetical protein [Clostridiaceae bacterium]
MRIPFQINSGGKDVLGVMHIPNRQNDIPVVIIMCYGLNGNRTEQHRMSVKLGEMCEVNSVNLVRFDYANVGVSEGDFFFSSISERVRNVIDIYNFVYGCFNREISVYLIGFSDGAKIAIQAQEHIGYFSGLICWNPIIKVPYISESMDRNPSGPVKLKIHQKYKKPYKPLFGVCLNTGLIKEIERDNSVSKLSNLGRTLFVFGEKDKYTKHIRAYFESRNLINTNIVIIEGAGHLFNSPAYERQVNESTIKWILEDSGQ